MSSTTERIGDKCPTCGSDLFLTKQYGPEAKHKPLKIQVGCRVCGPINKQQEQIK